MKNILWALPMMAICQVSQGQTSSDGEDLFAEEALPIVLSATRLRQSQLETPASVTIIKRDQIRASGARTIVEALRSVPGLSLGYSHKNTPEVSIHGFLTEFSRRLQVLVDGQSVFKPGLSRVLWGNLPINIDEVERIEVVRGPNTSSYGSNAFMGVINIITRLPSDVESHSASLVAGNNGIADAYVRYAKQGDQFSYRISAGHQQDDGFNGDYRNSQRFDENERDYFRADLSYNADIKNDLRLTLGHSQSEQQIDLFDTYQVDPVHPLKISDSSLQFNWQHHLNDKHSVTFNSFYSSTETEETWDTCPPAFFLTQELNALYETDMVYTDQFISALTSGLAPPTPPSLEVAALAQAAYIRLTQIGTASVCGQANQDFDEVKWGFELQDTYEFNDNFRLVSGLGMRKDKIRGNSLFDGEPENSTYYLFANAEWKLSPNWILNGGLLYEDDDYLSAVTSPRLALNYITSDHSSLRFIVAKGIRTPDFYEQVGHRHYQVVNLETPVNGNDTFATFYLTPQSQGGLQEETIFSREIGWFYSQPNYSLDIKLFHETIEDGIEGLFSVSNFDPQNSLDFTNKGLDVQLDYTLSAKDKLWLSYSYLDHTTDKGRSVAHQVAKQTASIRYQHLLSDSAQFSMAYYLQDIASGNNFERVDMRIGKQFNLNQSQLDLDLVVQHRLSKDAFFTSRNVVGDQTIAFVRARINF